MRSHLWKPFAPALFALALCAVGSPTLHAQDQGDNRRDQPPAEHHDEHADQAEKYRRAHPHAAARCHDGFFTRTTDRARACSKHGGIDVWLAH